jgi:hypothetical protein
MPTARKGVSLRTPLDTTINKMAYKIQIDRVSLAAVRWAVVGPDLGLLRQGEGAPLYTIEATVSPSN